jgi:ribosomal protein S27AE
MSWQDIYTFYVEPDDDCDHPETEEQADGVYCLRCNERLGTIEDLRMDSDEYLEIMRDAVAKEGTPECTHIYMMPDYHGHWHCDACGWTELNQNAPGGHQ